MTHPIARRSIALAVLGGLFGALFDPGGQSAFAAPLTTTGQAALALAGVIAPQSALLSAYDRRVVASLFDGRTGTGIPANKKITVVADSIVCRVSNVDLTARSCELTFKAAKRSLKGRAANEVFATLAAAGVQAQGAAGSVIETVTKLQCTLDTSALKDKAGGGAECSLQTDQ